MIAKKKRRESSENFDNENCRNCGRDFHTRRKSSTSKMWTEGADAQNNMVNGVVNEKLPALDCDVNVTSSQ